VDTKIPKVDVLLRASLESCAKPDADLIENVKVRMLAEKAKMPTIRRGLSKAVLIFAATLVLTFAVALAAGMYLGSFDRLMGVVETDTLHPVEMGIVIGEYSHDGIEIEVVAVGVYANAIDIYIILKDLVGNRFDGEVRLWTSVGCVNGTNQTVAGTASQVIYRGADGTVILRNRNYFVHPISGSELVFVLHDIRYNVITADGTCADGLIGDIGWDEMFLGWHFVFELELDADEIARVTLVADELGICYGDATLMEVVISPYTVFLRFEGESISAETVNAIPEIVLNTTSGSIARQTDSGMVIGTPIFSEDSFDEDGFLIFTPEQIPTVIGFTVLWELHTEFLDLDTVVSVEVDGVVVGF